MALTKLELQVPEELLRVLGKTKKEAEQRVREHVVLDLVEGGEISLRYGADVLGLTYQEMLKLMGEHEVPVVNYSPEDLDKEVKALDKLFS